jgi:RHS repeat-associated protein
MTTRALAAGRRAARLTTARAARNRKSLSTEATAQPNVLSGDRGTIATLAGNGTQGTSGDGGPATEAALALPQDVAFDKDGNLDILDSGGSQFSNRGIRQVNFAGTISTVAGSPSMYDEDQFLDADADGRIYYESGYNLGRLDTDGSNHLNGLAQNNMGQVGGGVLVDGNNDLYFAGVNGIFEIPAGGSQLVPILYGTVCSMAFDSYGDIVFTGYTDDNSGLGYICGGVGRISVDDQVQELAHGLTHDLDGVVVDSVGQIFVSQTSSARVSQLHADGTLTTIAGSGAAGFSGDGGDATTAQLSQPEGLTVDAFGNLYIADTGNERVREVFGVGASAPFRPTSGPQPPGPPIPATGLAPDEMSGGWNPSEACTCAQRMATQSPVNTSTGEFWHTFTDLAVPGRGLALNLTRTYSTNMAAQDGPFGHGWTSSYLMSITSDPWGRLFVHQENGSEVAFTGDGHGDYYPAQPRVLAWLSYDSFAGQYTFTRRGRDQYTFDGNGRLIAEQDLNGYRTLLSYDTGGNLSTITDPAGRPLHVTTVSGRISQISDPAGHVTAYGYNATGDLTSVTDSAGHTWTFGYDGAHRLTSMLDPNQQGASSPQPLINASDSSGRVTSQTDYAGRTTSFDYTSVPGATVTTDPRGNKTVDSYVGGLLHATTRGYGTGIAATTTFGYDPSTFATTSVVDANGKTRSFGYDSSGNQTSAADPLGHSQSWTYDYLNDVTSHTDAAGVTTTMSYDASGNLKTTIAPISTGGTATTTLHYGDATHPGDVTSITDPDGKTAHATYDAAGDLVSATDADGNTVTNTYNAVGWLMTTVSPRGNAPGANPADFKTTYMRDALGRVVQVTDPLGHHAQRSYDADGNAVSTTDANGNVTAYSYNADGQPLVTTRADTTTTSVNYDGAGNLTGQTDGANHTTTYNYDALNRVTSMTDPDQHTTSYGYDPASRLNSVTDPSGRTSIIGYDDAGRQVSIAYSDGVTHAVALGYDADNRRTSMTDGTGVSIYRYDSLGRLVSSTDGAGHTVGHTFDPAGRVTALTYPNGKTVTRSFDDAGRMTGVADWSGNNIAIGYDADGNLTSVRYPNGVTETTTFNNADQSTALSDTRGSTPLVSYGYARDGQGQLTTVMPTGLAGTTTESYGYSTLNQLTSVSAPGTSGSYSYDHADNMTHMPDGRTQTFDAASQLVSSSGGPGPVTFGYNAEGDRTSAAVGSSSASYGYDQADRLTSFVNGAGTLHAAYGYNGDGLRTSKTVNGTGVSFAWDSVSGTSPLLLDDGSYSYIYGPGGLTLEQISDNAPIISRIGTSSKIASVPVTGAVSLTLPTGIQKNDLIMIGVVESVSDTATTPDGYLADLGATGGTAGARIQMFHRVATGTESTVSVSFSPNVPVQPKAIIAVVYRGVDPDSPFDASNVGSATLAATVPVGSVSFTRPHGELALFEGAVLNVLDATWTPPTGLTAREAAHTNLVSGQFADKAVATIGVAGPYTATSSQTANLVSYDVALKVAPDRYYIQHDQQGSTRLLSDPEGQISSFYTYNPYGQTTGKSGAASSSLLYGGQYQDSETGFYYLRARYYDPATSNFVTVDPLSLLTRSPYNYGGNNPLNFSDPSGLAVELDCAVSEATFILWKISFINCQAVDSEGNLAEVDTYVSGPALGLGWSAFSVLGVSNAPTVFELQEQTREWSVSFDVLGIGSTAYAEHSDSGNSDVAASGVGGGLDLEVSIGFFDKAKTTVKWLGCTTPFRPDGGGYQPTST